LLAPTIDHRQIDSVQEDFKQAGWDIERREESGV
jgi:hypothetical protein